MNGVNIFENRKASKLFAELSNSLEGEKRTKFTETVKATFDALITSYNGDRFKVTEEEVARAYDFVVA